MRPLFLKILNIYETFSTIRPIISSSQYHQKKLAAYLNVCAAKLFSCEFLSFSVILCFSIFS